jgi:hypothetical protein
MVPDGRLVVTAGIDAPYLPKRADVGLYIVRIPAGALK